MAPALSRAARMVASCSAYRGLPMVRLVTISTRLAAVATWSAATAPPPGAGGEEARSSSQAPISWCCTWISLRVGAGGGRPVGARIRQRPVRPRGGPTAAGSRRSAARAGEAEDRDRVAAHGDRRVDRRADRIAVADAGVPVGAVVSGVGAGTVAVGGRPVPLAPG